MKKKMCYNCCHRGKVWRFPKELGENMPHCHCERPGIPESEWGWGTLREAFDSACDYYRAWQNTKVESQSQHTTAA